MDLKVYLLRHFEGKFMLYITIFSYIGGSESIDQTLRGDRARYNKQFVYRGRHEFIQYKIQGVPLQAELGFCF